MSTTTTARHHPHATPAPRVGPRERRTRSLGQYVGADSGNRREVLLLERPDGSALLVDCERGNLSDGRLLAHLAPDEPINNAHLLCELYLADETRGRCRAVTREDFELARQATPLLPEEVDATLVQSLKDASGHLYELRELATFETVLELRWTRSRETQRHSGFDVVSYREVVGALQAYEPARTLTSQAIARRAGELSTRCLRQEYERLAQSRIVLNRGLREAVERRVRNGEVSMSEIAIRCARRKVDRRGHLSGETSWLGRRIGQIPEAGQSEPTPWVSSEVLGLIAREGLSLSPQEVEI